MILDLLNKFTGYLGIVSQSPLFFLWVGFIAFISFLFIYFLFTAPLFFYLSQYNPDTKNWRQNSKRRKEIYNEIKISIISIFIFGIYGSITWLAHKYEIVKILFSFDLNIFLFEVLFLFFWNELHFFIVHRMLHIPWLYRKVHYIHHRSEPPTSFAVFSLHWFESILLGSVMITVMFIHDFQLASLLSLPLFSLFFNTIAHSNMEKVLSKDSLLVRIAQKHGDHHRYYERNYGFALPIFDWVHDLFKSYMGEKNADVR